MTPANKKRVKAISEVNFQRMVYQRNHRLGNAPPEPTQEQITKATALFLKQGGKISVVSIAKDAPCSPLISEVDKYLMGG